MIGALYLISEAWSSPTFAMLLDTTDPKNHGLTINVYFLFCASAGMLSTAILEEINIYYHAENHVKVYGYTLATMMLIGFVGSTVSFFIAGIYYSNYMLGKQVKKAFEGRENHV